MKEQVLVQRLKVHKLTFFQRRKCMCMCMFYLLRKRKKVLLFGQIQYLLFVSLRMHISGEVSLWVCLITTAQALSWVEPSDWLSREMTGPSLGEEMKCAIHLKPSCLQPQWGKIIIVESLAAHKTGDVLQIYYNCTKRSEVSTSPFCWIGGSQESKSSFSSVCWLPVNNRLCFWPKPRNRHERISTA